MNGDHTLLRFRHPGGQAPGSMVALPDRALQLATDRLGQADVGIAHQKLDVTEAAFLVELGIAAALRGRIRNACSCA